MSILAAIMGAEQRSSLGHHPSEHGIWNGWGFGSVAGVPVTDGTMMGSPAVWGAVQLIASTIAAMPVRIVSTETGEPVPHRLNSLLGHQPNPHLSAMAWRQTQILNRLLTGNRYAWIDREGPGGDVASLWHLESRSVQPVRAYRKLGGGVTVHPDEAASPLERRKWRLFYHYTDADGHDEYFHDQEIFHVAGLSIGGVLGFDPVRTHARTLALDIAAQQTATSMFENDATPGGILKRPPEAPPLSPAGERKLLEAWQDAHGGPGRKGRVAILQEGTAFEKVTFTLAEMQYIEARSFHVLDVARLFQVPPHFLGWRGGGSDTYSNLEQEFKELISLALWPHMVAETQEVRRKLLPIADRDRYRAEFDMSVLLAPDSKTRAEYLGVLVDRGIITTAIAARLERLPAVPASQGGDTYRAPGGVQAAAAIATVGASVVQARSQVLDAFRELVGAAEQRAARQQAGKTSEAALAIWERVVGPSVRALAAAVHGSDKADQYLTVARSIEIGAWCEEGPDWADKARDRAAEMVSKIGGEQ